MSGYGRVMNAMSGPAQSTRRPYKLRCEFEELDNGYLVVFHDCARDEPPTKLFVANLDDLPGVLLGESAKRKLGD